MEEEYVCQSCYGVFIVDFNHVPINGVVSCPFYGVKVVGG